MPAKERIDSAMIFYITTTQRVRGDDSSQLCVNVELPYTTVEQVADALKHGAIVGKRLFSVKAPGEKRLRIITGRSDIMLNTAGVAMVQMPSVEFEEAKADVEKQQDT